MKIKLRLKKMAAAAFIAILLITAFAETSFAAGEISPIKDSQRYARAQLAGMKGGSRLLKAYSAVRKGLKNGSSKINLSEYKLSAKEFQKVYYAVTDDHPEFFWIGNSVSWSTINNRLVNCTPKYTIKGSKLKNAKKVYNAKVKSLVSEIDPAMSDYEKEKYLYEKLSEMITYDASAPRAHDSYGAIVEGKAVCEGYAEAFQHLLNECGVQAFGVSGLSNNPQSGSRENHKWNIVKLGGDWYHADLTWDDQPDYTYHSYFNLTSEEIKTDHIIKGNTFRIPDAAGSEYGRKRFFEEKSAYLEEYDKLKIASGLLSGGGTAGFLFGSGISVDEFREMYYEDIVYFGNALGIYGEISAGYSTNGSEIVLTIQ